METGIKSDLEKILKAVDERVVIKLQYKNLDRTIEPLAVKNDTMLVGWQTGGKTSGERKLPGWFQCPISGVEGLEVTKETFSGTPPGFDAEKYK